MSGKVSRLPPESMQAVAAMTGLEDTPTHYPRLAVLVNEFLKEVNRG